MREGGRGGNDESPGLIERASLYFSQPTPGTVLHSGDENFNQELQKLYSAAESNGAERLLLLKAKLRNADTETFWELLTEGLANITGAQCAFVSKRILLDDENIAVEMPPIGEPGPCLIGAAIYFNDGKGIELRDRNFNYHAHSCPCAYMRHDKVFIIPERLNEFIANNLNKLPIPGEAYIGIPLFAEDRCVGHFGLMWSAEGAAERSLSWGCLEMLCHALEDMILERLLEGRDFAKPAAPASKPVRVVPHEAVTVAQSLKPYARSLSHELRTPMQGVVGMLDVMYATVQEAAEQQRDYRIRQIFETLKANIETVQDSSRRAVEAADNVVHAYDMNMGVPDKPHSTCEDEDALPGTEQDKRPDIVVTGSNITLSHLRSNRRKRRDTCWSSGKPSKVPATEPIRTLRNWPSADSDHAPSEVNDLAAPFVPAPFSSQSGLHAASIEPFRASTPSSPSFQSQHTVAPGLRHTNLRDVLQYVINDSLKVGGRPESAIANETNGGEVIEVSTQSPSGGEKVKVIEWSVDASVPKTMLIDERDFSKMISCVFLNAIKFTEEGKITLTARLSPKCRYVLINVRDTGSGIPAAFLPNLFKPFSREDDSLTRQSEGLGLGLLVAKGVARKLGGDLLCTRSETSGPNRGTDFELRVPVTPLDVCSRPGSPFSSPAPSLRSRHSVDVDVPPPGSVSGALVTLQTPPQAPRALREALADHCRIQTTDSPPPLPPGALSPSRRSSTDRRTSAPNTRRTSVKKTDFDRQLAKKHPLTFLVAEDNKINRKLLVSMLRKLGHNAIYEAYDGADAVRQMTIDRLDGKEIDVVLMDLWMPFMDGYEAAERILSMDKSINGNRYKKPTILAVTADVTDGALERTAKAGMKGFMTKPYKLLDLERLIVEYCAQQDAEDVMPPSS